MKTCTKCNLEKDDSEFRKHRNDCKKCETKRVTELKKIRYRNDPVFRKKENERTNNRKKIKYDNNLIYRQEVLAKRKSQRDKNPEKQMLRQAYRRSIEKQVPFLIKEEDISIPEICPVLNVALKKGEGSSSDSSPSLDRIIPEKGYVKDNVIVVSNKANRIKNNATPEEIIAVGEFYKKLLEEAKKNE